MKIEKEQYKKYQSKYRGTERTEQYYQSRYQRSARGGHGLPWLLFLWHRILKTCKAYISVLGDEKAQADTIQGLKSAEGYIRRELARGLNMRNTPEITFVLDQSIEYGVNMSKKIDDVTRGLKSEGE